MQCQQLDCVKNGMILIWYKENLPLAHILSVPLDAEDEVNDVEHIVEVLVRKMLDNISTKERLDQSHLYPNLEVPGLTCPG